MKDQIKNLLNKARCGSAVRTHLNSRRIDVLCESGHLAMVIQNDQKPLHSQRYQLTEKGFELLERAR